MSIVCAVIPICTNDYQYVGGTCDISYTSERGIIYRYSLFYDWLWIVIIFDIYAYARVMRRIRQEFTIMNHFINAGRVLVRRLRYYPLILVICYTPITISRTLSALGSSQPDWLILLSFGSANLLGAFNAIVYGLSENVRIEFKAWVLGLNRLEPELKSLHSLSEIIY